jgi:hypothetical protein
MYNTPSSHVPRLLRNHDTLCTLHVDSAAASAAGALQRRIGQPVSYATKSTVPAAGAAATPPAAGAAARTGSKKKLISSSARTSVTSDSDTIERLQEEVRAALFAA